MGSFPKDLQTKRFPEAFATLWHFLYHPEAALKAGLLAAIPKACVFVSHLWLHCSSVLGSLWNWWPLMTLCCAQRTLTHLLWVFFFFFNLLHFPWRDLRGRLYDPIFTKNQMNKTNANEIKTTYLMIVAMVSWFLPVLICLSCHPRAVFSSLSSRPDLGSMFGSLLTVCSRWAAWDSLPSEP